MHIKNIFLSFWLVYVPAPCLLYSRPPTVLNIAHRGQNFPGQEEHNVATDEDHRDCSLRFIRCHRLILSKKSIAGVASVGTEGVKLVEAIT